VFTSFRQRGRRAHNEKIICYAASANPPSASFHGDRNIVATKGVLISPHAGVLIGRFWHKADVTVALMNVRFQGEERTSIIGGLRSAFGRVEMWRGGVR
jgi:hypothetical protein